MSQTCRLSPGHKLAGKYIIEEVLSNGPMASTYRACQIFSKDPLILRQTLSTEQAEGFHPGRMWGLEMEFQLGKKLEHPSFPVVHDFFEDDGCDYLTREYREGKTLSRITGNGLSMERIRNISGQILSALEEVHRKGIVFLGLEPESILLNSKDEVSFTKLAFTQMAGQRVEKEMYPYISQDYGAPEITEFEPVGVRADIFSFGALLFYMLCGKTIDVISSPADLNSYGISPSLKSAIIRCIYTDPSDRYQNVAELREELFAADSLDMPSFEAVDTGGFTDIGQIRGGFHIEELDHEYQGRIIKFLFIVMAIAGVMTPLMPFFLNIISGVVFAGCLLGILAVRSVSFHHYELGDLGFSIKGPGFVKSYSWSKFVKFTRRKGGFRITGHMVNGKQMHLRTEDLDGMVALLSQVSGKPIIEIDMRKRTNLHHDDEFSVVAPDDFI